MPIYADDDEYEIEYYKIVTLKNDETKTKYHAFRVKNQKDGFEHYFLIDVYSKWIADAVMPEDIE